MALSKSQVMNALAERSGQDKKSVQAVMEALTELAYAEAKNGFSIPGLGKLVVSQRSARTGRNPATGETIQIPAKTVLKFRIAKAAKEAIL